MIFESNCCPDCGEIKPCQKLSFESKTLLATQSVTPERIANSVSYPNPDRTNSIRRVFLITNPSLAKLRNQTAAELRSQGFSIVEVPVTLNSTEAIAWINRRANVGDVAITLQIDAFSNPNTRGVTAFYRSGNENYRQRAEQLISQILRNVPNWVDRGARPDTDTAFGSLALVRRIKVPSIVLNVGFETSPEDRLLLSNRSQAIAQGIANGLVLWNRAEQAYTPININVNGKASEPQGLIVEGNSYIPLEILDKLSIDLDRPRSTQVLTYNRVTYIRAIDLRELGVFVGWNSSKQAVILRTMPPLNPKQISSIMGRGYLSKTTLEAFLKQNNPKALERFPDIADLYLQEAAIEDVNSDIAFTQALVETNFFRFSRAIQPTQNNFAAVREIGSLTESATFPNARLGVRAHIQLLKAYASLDPIGQELVTPRFRFIARGIAPQIEQLSLYYSPNPSYADEILGILRQLYQYQFARSL